jgi:hypothetical protein
MILVVTRVDIRAERALATWLGRVGVELSEVDVDSV